VRDEAHEPVDGFALEMESQQSLSRLDHEPLIPAAFLLRGEREDPERDEARRGHARLCGLAVLDLNADDVGQRDTLNRLASALRVI